MMNKYTKAAVVLSLALLGAGCNDFIQGPGLTESPNSPTSGTIQQMFIAVQANMAVEMEGQLARDADMYTQQLIGSNNQQLTQGTQYGETESSISGFFSGMYTGGGLNGLRKIQAGADQAGDKLMYGMAKVLEGYFFGTATSIWGDIPYSEANDPTILTPKLDAQADVYTAVQKRLDEGITALQAAATTPTTCEPSDTVYCAGSSPAATRAQEISRWIAAAYTLKARFYLDLVERNGNAAYQSALDNAKKGINEAPTSAANAMNGAGPGDFRTFHGTTQDVDGNIWAEFLLQRGGDIAAGNVLVSLLKNRDGAAVVDPRLSNYFDTNASGQYAGKDQNNANVGGAASVVSTARRAFTFRQPLITWAENQLIQAEANFKLGNTAAAVTNLNAERTLVGLPALPAPTFADIMLEKYVVDFQNIIAWMDYRRTCLPAVTPYQTSPQVPGRLPYGSAERSNNPNIPLPNAFPAGTTAVDAVRNWNDPNACPRP
jgi:hypothetical protein